MIEGGPRSVTQTVFGPTTGTSATVTIPPTAAGEVVAVVIQRPNTVGASVSMVTVGAALDDWQASEPDGCGTATETWISGSLYGPVDVGASSVTVTMSTSETFFVYVYELGGVTQPAGGDDASGDAVDVPAPAVQAEPGQLVFSTITSCSGVALMPTSPFTALDEGYGVAAAYYIPEVRERSVVLRRRNVGGEYHGVPAVTDPRGSCAASRPHRFVASA